MSNMKEEREEYSQEPTLTISKHHVMALESPKLHAEEFKRARTLQLPQTV